MFLLAIGSFTIACNLVCSGLIQVPPRLRRVWSSAAALVEFTGRQQWQFDFIVVGGGGAGCPLARRLAEIPGKRVLLVERGDQRDRHPLTHDISGAGMVVADPRVSQLLITNQGVRSHIPAVLGGGTALGMAIMAHDDDEKFLRKFEQAALPSGTGGTGGGGGTGVTGVTGFRFDRRLFNRSIKWINHRISFAMPLEEPVASHLAGSLRSGAGVLRGDYRQASTSVLPGAMWNGHSIFAGRQLARVSSDCLLGESLPNDRQPRSLHILVNTTATQIILQGKRATCVALRGVDPWDLAPLAPQQISTPDSSRSLFAQLLHHTLNYFPTFASASLNPLASASPPPPAQYRLCVAQPHGEIFLSAGAIFTPYLLLRSGISHPHLGRHLQDRPLVPVTMFKKASAPTSIGRVCQVVALKMTCSPATETATATETETATATATPPGVSRFYHYNINASHSTNCLPTCIEEMDGGRLVEGFLYATRVYLPPNLRTNRISDWATQWLHTCADNPALAECENWLPHVTCIQRLASLWHFISAPYSSGRVLVNPHTQKPLVDFDYVKDPRDITAMIVGLRPLLKMVMSQPTTSLGATSLGGPSLYDVMEVSSSHNACPMPQFNDLVSGLHSSTSSDYLLEGGVSDVPYGRAFNGIRTPIATFPIHLPDPRNRPQLENYIRATMASMWHWMGSAALGKVLTPDFRVSGISGLSVVDASALPLLPRLNPTAFIMALAHYVGSLRAREIAAREGRGDGQGHGDGDGDGDGDRGTMSTHRSRNRTRTRKGPRGL